MINNRNIFLLITTVVVCQFGCFAQLPDEDLTVHQEERSKLLQILLHLDSSLQRWHKSMPSIIDKNKKYRWHTKIDGLEATSAETINEWNSLLSLNLSKLVIFDLTKLENEYIENLKKAIEMLQIKDSNGTRTLEDMEDDISICILIINDLKRRVQAERDLTEQAVQLKATEKEILNSLTELKKEFQITDSVMQANIKANTDSITKLETKLKKRTIVGVVTAVVLGAAIIISHVDDNVDP